jgi:general secretion pathway protein L
MAESIIIRLGSQYNDVIHWLITSADKQTIIASGEIAGVSQLTELTEKASTRKVTVLVPACDVAFKKLNVPSKSTRAIKQAVPYMLEDELAQDVDNLFFAYAQHKPVGNDANCYVAVVDDEQMQTWLSWLTEADISTRQLLPDALTLPVHNDAYSAIQLGEQFLVRQGVWPAVTLEHNLWPLLSQQWSAVEPMTIANYSTLPEVPDNIELQPQAEELPLFLMAKFSDTCAVNLLQDKYAKKEKSSMFWQHWRLAASFLIVALVINFTTKLVNLYQLDNQLVALENEVSDSYQKTFAENKNKKVHMNKIKSLIQFKLRAVSGGDNSEKFFPLMNKITPAFVAVKGLKPETLKYDHKHNEIRMQASAKKYQEFELFKTTLEKAQLTVSQGSQNNQGDQIVGSFSIKDPS